MRVMRPLKYYSKTCHDQWRVWKPCILRINGYTETSPVYHGLPHCLQNVWWQAVQATSSDNRATAFSPQPESS